MARRSRRTWLAGFWFSVAAAAVACGGTLEPTEESRDDGAGAQGGGGGLRSGAAGSSHGTRAGTGQVSQAGEGVSHSGEGPGGGSAGMLPTENGLGGFCGGCAETTYRVRCARHVVSVPTAGEPDFPDFRNPERACEVAQAEVPVGGEAGAASTSGQGGAGGSAAPDLCDTYVDPPTVYFDDGGCTGVDDEDPAGECLVDDECCVIVKSFFCGV